MIPVKLVYNPRAREYFVKGLATLIDCSRLAIEEYNKTKGTNYEFMELGKMAFSQRFHTRNKDWVIYTISCAAYQRTKPDVDYFTAKVFSAPNWNMNSYVFFVLEINLNKNADPRFHKILPFKEVVYDSSQKIPSENQVLFELRYCLDIAVQEYNKDKGFDYSVVGLLHASRELVYAGVDDCWLYTISFCAACSSREDVGKFTVEVMYGNKRDGVSALVLASDMKNDEKERQLNDTQKDLKRLQISPELNVENVIYNPPHTVDCESLFIVIRWSFLAVDLYNRCKDENYSYTGLVEASYRNIRSGSNVDRLYTIVLKASLPNSIAETFLVHTSHNLSMDSMREPGPEKYVHAHIYRQGFTGGVEGRLIMSND